MASGVCFAGFPCVRMHNSECLPWFCHACLIHVHDTKMATDVWPLAIFLLVEFACVCKMTSIAPLGFKPTGSARKSRDWNPKPFPWSRGGHVFLAYRGKEWTEGPTLAIRSVSGPGGPRPQPQSYNKSHGHCTRFARAGIKANSERHGKAKSCCAREPRVKFMAQTCSSVS